MENFRATVDHREEGTIMGKILKPDGAGSASESRRHFLAKTSASVVGISLGMVKPFMATTTADATSGLSRVSFVTGDNRREMIYQALKPLEKEVKAAIKGKQVIIKPNFVSVKVPLSATHPDAVRGVLDFLKPIYKKTVIIGESAAIHGTTLDGYANYNYLPLEREYNIRLVDMNEQPASDHWILDKEHHPLKIRIINTYTDPNNFIISVTRLKTHDTVVTTLSVKNMVMGSPLNDYKKNEKPKMHQGTKEINFNLFLIARSVQPRLAILDGSEGMEGNGPIRGTPVEHGVALASTDFIAADRIGVELMGIDFNDVGYLTYCALAGMGQSDREKIEIIGPDPSAYKKTYKLHDKIDQQLQWK